MNSHQDVAGVDAARRFGGIERLYGPEALARLGGARAAVIGLGGVGSWAAEALARTGFGRLRIVDLDHVAESNVNRQLHAVEPTFGMAKVDAMGERLAQINPRAVIEKIDAFLDEANVGEIIADCDVVLDAIDQVRAKLALVLTCRARGIPLVVAGAAGGKRDPAMIRRDDLARTQQDPLLARLRARLRREHGFPRDPRRRFGVEAIYSIEPLRAAGGACAAGGPGLNCSGYGSSMMITAAFGLFAAASATEFVLASGSAPVR